ncbi:MAG: hypothetical protein II557_04920 [Clostridia bacterium]|nr:hypothetical protein [Clostridia bacterium]MBR4186180.1 hypothetical protein [Clostridia bacterium]
MIQDGGELSVGRFSRSEHRRKARRSIMSCFCNLFDNDTIIWIIVIILLLVLLGN